MATYPTLPTEFKSDPKPLNKLDIDRAEDGTARARSFYTSDKHGIPLTHPRITAAEKATLAAFYAANRLIPFDYVSLTDGGTYSCLFAKPPRYELHSDGRWTAAVELEQV